MSEPFAIPQLPPLREPYQTRGYADIRAAAARLHRERNGGGYGVLAVCPTGGGKTVIGLHVAAGAIARGGRALWLAPRDQLVKQPVKSLAKLGWFATRVIRDGRVEGDPTARLTVASIQTLVARDYAPEADVVIFDECRHFVAEQWGRIAARYKTSVRLGLDATPARTDGTPLGDLFDVLVQISSVQELTRLGWLVPAVIHAPPAPQRELAGTPLEKWRLHADGQRTIVFCQSKLHAAHAAAEFNAAGIAAEAVDADSSDAQREDALERVRSGVTRVLCNCLLYTEGLDLVELECVIIARGVSSESVWLQMGGRGLRIAPHIGKTRCTVLDLRGHVHTHLPFDEPRSWHLEGKPVRRLDPLPSVVQCRKCFAWSRGGTVCSGCGAEVPPPKPPRIKAAELQEFRRKTDDEETRIDRFRKFVGEALSSGKSPWSAMHRFRGTYGENLPKQMARQLIREAEEKQCQA